VTALITARGLADRVAAGGEPLGLTTDPRRVEQMLADLMGNAVEHSGRDVRVQTGAGGVHGYVEMADAGPGISRRSICRTSWSASARPTPRGQARAAVWAWLSRWRTPGS
jgi:C4-dicarboxylate-specific signal transduction histidine kinase